jgi:hypothetical protein
MVVATTSFGDVIAALGQQVCQAAISAATASILEATSAM